MTDKEKGLLKVQELVARFTEQLPAYKKSDYNETQTRRDFIDPLFKALGWDIDNKQGFAESYREVIHEDKVKVGNATKAPDYSFRLGGGQRLFFVEAKKPSVLIKDDIQPAYQIRRYGWSAKLNVSVITDFEEFAIYDCTKKPNPTDKSSVARVKYFTFKEYETEWDFLWNTFSKEAVLKGSFDKFIGGNANKKGTATVDKAFLNSLDEWRTLLAETISKENKQLDEDELNYVVQQTLDRIIFLRICEDRSIEPYGSLQNAVKSGDYYKNLLQEFKQADDKYNSGLFDFKKDKLSHQLIVNNKTLKTIINQLYYPECPYEFSVLSVEILGSAYEQFLGKTITINNKGKAVIELKPEVRKAGGVYYTPQYIVDYIVTNTIGTLTKNKTPNQVAEIKIVDPACGSGSFLLGAYQYLLNWHKDYYTQNPNKKNPITADGNLTTTEKKKILLNNIYGVDIDTNAVEVTKLSLLLKCMEGETQASIAQQMTMFKERVLPTLDDNIKSGNSLIDTDYYDNQLDFGEERKIKPFSWQKAFPSVFNREVKIEKDDLKILATKAKEHAKKAMDYAFELEKKLDVVSEPTVQYGKQWNGGFDVVIGNPPYVSIKEIALNQKQYFANKYQVAVGQFDLYVLFIEKSFSLLNEIGLMGMITSNTFINNKDLKNLREILLKSKNINEIINLGETVFEEANLDVSILIVKNKYDKYTYSKIITNALDFYDNKFHIINQKTWLENNLDFVFNINISTLDIKVINKLFEKKLSLSKFLELPRGIEIGGNSELISKVKTKNNIPIIYGRSINKYQIVFDNNYIEFDKSNKSVFKDFSIYNQEKILIQRIRNLTLKQRIVATIDNENYVCTNTLRIGYLKETSLSIKYLLGLLNSKTINWIFLKKFLNKDIYAYQLEQIPIKTIDFSNQEETLSYNQIINHVEQLLQLNKELLSATLESKKEQIKQKIEYHEDKINALVYQLYNLTEDEIKLIENN